MYRVVIPPTLLYGAEIPADIQEAGTEAQSFPRIDTAAEMAGPDPRLARAGILSIYVMLRQLQLHWSGHFVRMYDERLPKRLFYGDVATAARRKTGQVRRYKDTLKTSLKSIQINPANWEDLVRDRTTDLEEDSEDRHSDL
nr:unnamed protein product [Spirometra erinaceieuropaei]